MKASAYGAIALTLIMCTSFGIRLQGWRPKATEKVAQFSAALARAFPDEYEVVKWDIDQQTAFAVKVSQCDQPIGLIVAQATTSTVRPDTLNWTAGAFDRIYYFIDKEVREPFPGVKLAALFFAAKVKPLSAENDLLRHIFFKMFIPSKCGTTIARTIEKHIFDTASQVAHEKAAW
jgi:hypothetical protein